MPNRAGQRAKNQTATAETNGQEATVTATAPSYDLSAIGDLGSSYAFKRAGAGRKRVPSPFDDLVETYVDQGTKFLPVPDEDTGKAAIEDLQKACNWDRGRENFRGYGLTKRLTRLAGIDGVADGLYVVFEVKAEKEKRERKPKPSADAETPTVEAQEAATTD